MKNINKTIYKILILIAAPLIIGTLLSSAMMSGEGGDDMPKTDAEDLWKYITETNNYKDWEQWPDKTGMYEGESPHGDYLKLYVNKKAFDALVYVTPTLPDQSIIVKENYNMEKKLVAVTPMYKVKGYNREAGDWFWAKYGADGKTMKSGKIAGCIDCHSKKKDNDYLFSKD